MSEPVYVIEAENGEYDDRRKDVIFADTNEAIAYQRADVAKAETVYFSIWQNGMLMSQYMRSASQDYCGKWERNCGEINHKLEGE